MLVDQMKTLLATAFSFYLKAQYFHWNVTGPNFAQYHEFLGNLYEEVHSSIDKIAEEIRTLDSYAPGSLGRFKELSKVEDETMIPAPGQMMNILYFDNQRVMDALKAAHELAEEQKVFGLINFLEDRMDVHSKHAWMLRSFIKQ